MTYSGIQEREESDMTVQFVVASPDFMETLSSDQNETLMSRVTFESSFRVFFSLLKQQNEYGPPRHRKSSLTPIEEIERIRNNTVYHLN